jgi:DNA-directed RNA polymerase specialized sigma24 family protein
VRQALTAVAPGDRRALVLHAWAGLSYLDVAARLGVTLAAVKSRISRARSALAAAGLRGGGSR